MTRRVVSVSSRAVLRGAPRPGLARPERDAARRNARRAEFKRQTRRDVQRAVKRQTVTVFRGVFRRFDGWGLVRFDGSSRWIVETNRHRGVPDGERSTLEFDPRVRLQEERDVGGFPRRAAAPDDADGIGIGIGIGSRIRGSVGARILLTAPHRSKSHEVRVLLHPVVVRDGSGRAKRL